MRAREPALEGHVEVDGAKVGYEVFGDGSPTVLLLPTWTIIHSRFWKQQVPYLARHFRVVSYDRLGNGMSERSLDPGAYRVDSGVRQALAVLDATATEQAVVVGLSRGGQEALALAAEHADRVLGAVFIGNSLPVEPGHDDRESALHRFRDPYPANPRGWERLNAAYWLDHYEDFVEFFFDQCFSEPHSTKQREDCVGWAGETTPQVLLVDQRSFVDRDTALGWAQRVSVPTLVLHGDDDRVSPLTRAETLARRTGADLVVLEGAGHIPLARDPVRVNLLLREFVDRVVPPPPGRTSWTRGRSRPRRALVVSSPIGLGHARRDVAIVAELRRRHPDLQVDWLAQHPVTRMLDVAGEHVHPASASLASESAHLESESGEHRLHCFQAWRRMDEILLADFLVFHDVVAGGDYDLVIGDEAWEVDYYLHENPELKRFAYCWLTDFVGWLPMPDGGPREALLTADYNAEMIEHIARYPRVRDLALFVGNPHDIVPDSFGPGLPPIREWVQEHYRFPGYVTGFDPDSGPPRDELRAELGYLPDEPVCVVTVGGSGVGSSLLRRAVEAYPHAEALAPGLRMLLVTGPRIDPASVPSARGVDVRAFVPGLHRHLAASDLAVVQGGLTTCMELTASQRPFVYVPLRSHFEQSFHVPHRLQGHGAGRRLEFADAEPEALGQLIAAQIGREVGYRPVERHGAARAADAIAELL